MLTAIRTAVTELLNLAELGVPVHGYVPTETGQYPCVVVGRPEMAQALDAEGVADLAASVHVCGRPQTNDSQDELDKLADRVWSSFLGANTRHAVGMTLTVEDITATAIAVGAMSVPAYTFTVLASVNPCPD